VQHSSFRDILRTIEDGDLPDVETVKFGHNEELQLDNWVRTKHYKTFRDMLGTGITCHLQVRFSCDLFLARGTSAEL
jgi:hypothetical protein